jgi:triacylglycerol lipase
MLFLNIAALLYNIHINIFLKILIAVVLFGIYIFYNIKPRAGKIPSKRLKTMIGGYELILTATLCLISEILLYIYFFFISDTDINLLNMIINGVLCAILTFAMLLNGFIRAFTSSRQLKATFRLYIIFLWWVPVANAILFYLLCKNIRTEYDFELKKHERNVKRKHEQVCRTKYPLLMVHGIFFRDWKHVNYWGRIPNELIENGATIYYGKQQSSSSVEQSAAQLKQRIIEIINETGCGKVNIIAHSKGGLDSRYAISCLGLDQYVASLTTVNTPHFGCAFAGKLIEKTPDKITSFIGKQYEAVFSKLGDDKPDFFGGVSELTVEKCAELNRIMTDREGVLYQSVGSKMYSHLSAIFPLSIGYRMIMPLEGENDGLVATKSMAWGNFIGIITPPEKLGISHGDMVDLTRKNIYGFDVCEYYVELVKSLKDKGL